MRSITKGATDQSVVIRIVDSADGTPETGVTFETSGIDMWYRREGGLEVSITEATLAAANTAHTDGGFIHISDGYYRLDLPDAAVATGADGVLVGGAVTDMVVIGTYVELVDAKITGDPYARLGAPAGASVSADVAAVKVDTAAILVDTGTTLQAELDGIQADTEDIQSRLPAALNNGCIPADIQRVNDTEIQGDGSTTPWGPA